MLDQESEICRAWAHGKPAITRLYFFGSRVQGEHTALSDLDIAIVCLPGYFDFEKDNWAVELRQKLKIDVDLNEHDCRAFVLAKASGHYIQIFSRYGSENDFDFDDAVGEID